MHLVIGLRSRDFIESEVGLDFSEEDWHLSFTNDIKGDVHRSCDALALRGHLILLND